MNQIYLCQTCSGRKWQAQETLKHNIESIYNYYSQEKHSINYHHDWPMCSICVVDYNCKDNITEYILENHPYEVTAGYISIFKVENGEKWHMSKVKNIAMRLGARLGGSYLVSLDIDNFVTPEEIRLLASCNRFGLSYHGVQGFHDGSCGRIGCSTSNFFKIKGFREDSPQAGIHDIDLIRRLSLVSELVEFPPMQPAIVNSCEEKLSNTDVSVDGYKDTSIRFMFVGNPPEMSESNGTLYHKRYQTTETI